MLHREQLFESDEKNRLGTMRVDWYDGKLSNQWNPTKLLIELNNSRDIDLKKLQEELNYLQFELLYSFDKVLEITDGNGYDKEKNMYYIGVEYNYGIRLIPILDAYSYIYVYRKME
ncbi:hypothetical protein [Clostridium sp.]|uniref:hypothetical protein n=1 Tax=Clostridium sp. TaxID=1506 RepID=UPI00306F598F